jgi:hypothetical protein
MGGCPGYSLDETKTRTDVPYLNFLYIWVSSACLVAGEFLDRLAGLFFSLSCKCVINCASHRISGVFIRRRSKRRALYDT